MHPVNKDEAQNPISTLFEYRVGNSTTATANSARARRPTLSMGRQSMPLRALGSQVRVLYGDKESSSKADDKQAIGLLQMAESGTARTTRRIADSQLK
jgi:hypothetical protein